MGSLSLSLFFFFSMLGFPHLGYIRCARIQRAGSSSMRVRGATDATEQPHDATALGFPSEKGAVAAQHLQESECPPPRHPPPPTPIFHTHLPTQLAAEPDNSSTLVEKAIDTAPACTMGWSSTGRTGGKQPSKASLSVGQLQRH